MHELEIAQTILKAALAGLKKQPAARLKTVRIAVGAARAVLPENLRFLFEILARDTPARGARLAIETRPATARCRRCGWAGAIEAPIYACGACRSGDVEQTGGGELFLESLEVETNERQKNKNLPRPARRGRGLGGKNAAAARV